jgi:N-acetylglucosamine-6-phosphate deacetylase
MPKVILKGNLVLQDATMTQGHMIVEEDKISEIFAQKSGIQKEKGAQIIDYGDAYIAPGFVDLHLHGAMGKDVMDCREQSMRTIAEHQANHGITGFLGSTISSPLDTVLEAVRVINNSAQDPLPSEVLGVHVEGPFLSTREKGAHPVSHIRGITENDEKKLADASSGLHVIISMAPEVEDNLRFVSRLKERGFVVAIGHSDATYEQAIESFAKGVTHATHLYNAMSGFDHREPGVVGAVLDSEEVTAELIADGVHVHPAALRLAVDKKGPEKICLVTDSMLATGLGDGVYPWGEEKLEVLQNRVTVRKSGILAGSVLTLNEAIKNMIEWTGVTINQAINMASLYPAHVLGLEKEIGSIQIGKLANLVVLDREFNVVDTLLRGQSVLKKGNQNDR